MSGGFSERQRDDLLEAYAATVSILRDPAFLTYLSSKENLATSATTGCEAISPLALTKTLSRYVDEGEPIGVTRNLTYTSRWFCGTTAKTGQCGATDIFASVVEQWEKGATQSRLVNTIAHEMTHLLPTPDAKTQALECSKNPTQYILDAGYVECTMSGAPCSEAFLASYAFGDLVQCFFENQANPVDADECYETTLNMDKPNWFRRSMAQRLPSLACSGRAM